MATTPKRQRLRLARAELLALLSTTCEGWAKELEGSEPGIRPFEEWSPDEPMVVLCRTYNLRPADLARILSDLSDSFIYRASTSGFDERWDDPNPPHSA